MPTNEIKMKEATQQRREWDAKLNLINIELAKSDKTKELQSRRLKNETNIILAKKRKEKIVNQIAYIDGQSFPNIFLNKASESLRNFIRIEEDKGKVPSPYSEVLLKDILHDEKCICDTPVKKGSNEEKALTKKLATATTTVLNDRKNKIIYAIEQTNIFKESYSSEISKLREDLKLANEEIASINEELEAIKKDLAGINEEKIAQLEKDRADAKEKYGKAYSEVEYFSSILEKQRQNLKIYKDKQKVLLSRAGLQKNVADELDKIERLQAYIRSNLDQQEKDALLILEEEINKYLKKYLTKHYTASIDHENYEVNLFDEKNRRVPKSTGEGEVLKYAFISAVMAVVGNKSDRKLNSLVKPTLAPLLMDAPFTSLGDEYKRSTAVDISRNTSQLILMMLPNVLSDPALADAINPYIGKAYAVVSQQTGPQGNKPIISRKIFGKVINFNEFGCNYSGTKIEEIKNV
jgi:DNA sulfur modification protein DndD